MIHERNENPKIIDDVVNIEPLNDAELLRNLKLRYEKDLIYTNCGPTLLICNPFSTEANKVSKTQEQWDICKLYASKGEGEGNLPPHTYSLTSRTYRQ